MWVIWLPSSSKEFNCVKWRNTSPGTSRSWLWANPSESKLFKPGKWNFLIKLPDIGVRIFCLLGGSCNYLFSIYRKALALWIFQRICFKLSDWFKLKNSWSESCNLCTTEWVINVIMYIKNSVFILIKERRGFTKTPYHRKLYYICKQKE